MTESEKALAIHHLSRMVKAGRYLDSGAHISLLVLHSLRIALNALKERKTGKWIKDEYGTDHCSCCDYIPAYDTAIDDIYYSPYCPNCGAKMKGVEA